MYKAKQVDTDKALEAISDSRRYQMQATNLQIEKERSFLEGINKGLDIAEELFMCSNYEASTYEDGVKDTICYLAKELDVLCPDMQESKNAPKKWCEDFAERVRKMFMEGVKTN